MGRSTEWDSRKLRRGQPLAEVWKRLGAKPSPVAFPLPSGSCHRRLLITRSQFLPENWTEPLHPAGVGALVLHYPSHGSRAWRPVCRTKPRSHHPLFLLLGLRVEVFGLGGAASGPTWALRPSHAPYSKETPTTSQLGSTLSKVSGPPWCFLIRSGGGGPKPELSNLRSRGGKFVRPQLGDRELRVHPS